MIHNLKWESEPRPVEDGNDLEKEADHQRPLCQRYTNMVRQRRQHEKVSLVEIRQ